MMKMDERLEEIQALVTVLSSGRCGRAERERVRALDRRWIALPTLPGREGRVARGKAHTDRHF